MVSGKINWLLFFTVYCDGLFRNFGRKNEIKMLGNYCNLDHRRGKTVEITSIDLIIRIKYYLRNLNLFYIKNCVIICLMIFGKMKKRFSNN